MAKMYKKKELTFKDGYLVAEDNTIVEIANPGAYYQANRLEDLLQEHAYLEDQPKAVSIPSLKGFERKHIGDEDETLFVIDTPIYDKKQEEALAFMDELDHIKVNSSMNTMAQEFSDLLKFVKADEVVCDDNCVLQFDTPMLGNPLKWTEDTICNAIATIHGCICDGE